jgi:hypothetical protein
MDMLPTEQDSAASRNAIPVNSSGTEQTEPSSTDNTHTTTQSLIVRTPLKPGVDWTRSTNPAVQRAINELIQESNIRDHITVTIGGVSVDKFLSRENPRLPRELPLYSLVTK